MQRLSALSPVRGGRWLMLAALLSLPACSGGLHPVRGKVLYKGEPIKGAVVAFHPKNDDNATAIRPTGLTDENGVFTLSTQKDAGAPAGEYRVTVLWLEEPAPKADKPAGFPEPPSAPVDRLMGRYADPSKSGLTAVIRSGTKDLEPFELK
jgi:hypothetical protein